MATHEVSCQCGSLKVVAFGDPDFVIACNCRACQKRSGSPFGTAAYFRNSDIKISGDEKQWSRTADSGRSLVNAFCPNCGTTVYWTLEMRPDHVGVPVGGFDSEAPEPIRAIWTEQKHQWVQFPADWPTFEKGSPS